MLLEKDNCSMSRSCRDPYYIQVIFEYLLHMGLLDTATIFKEECERKKYPLPHNDFATDELKSNLLSYFDLGEEDPFFQVFHSSVTDSQPSPSIETKRLIANLLLYFASVSYVKANNPEKSSDFGQDDNKIMQSPNFLSLRNFLQTTCSTLENEPGFLPYFSLSSAANPLNHQLFLQTFKDSWISNLRKSLQEYLWLHHPAFKVPDVVSFIPSKAQSDIFCCIPHDNIANTTCETAEQKKKLFKGNHTDMVNDHKHFSEFSVNEENFAQDSESEMQHTMHSHTNTALFLKRPNLKGSTFSNTSTSNNIADMEECHQNYEQLKKKFGQLHSDYHNLIGVASELTCALESCVRGQQVDLRDALNKCVQIFPELFPQSQHQRKNKKKPSKKNILLDSKGCEWTLDIAHIKQDLSEGNVKNRLLLLQALRWAITKSSSDRRKCVMNQFLSSDLLNLQGETLLVALLTPPGVVTPHPLQQSAARLLNTFASVQSGRSYLAQNSEMVKATTSALREHDKMCTDSTTKNMLVAALQKLSLRRSQRIAMIQAGVVEWLFHQLANTELGSSYSLEYGTALLMNLCLHQAAKELCVPIGHSVFSVLINLLSSSIYQALPYINGTLYSLITHPRLNEVAGEVGLGKALEGTIAKQTNVDIKRQMEHILQYHQSLLQSDCANTFPLPVSEGELIDEDDEELDLLGEELDEQDPVRCINGELNGEDLLRTHYTLTENNEDLPKAHERSSSPLILRPTTPHHSSQTVSQSFTETGHGSSDNKFQESQDLTKRNNWHHRRSGKKQPQLFNRQEGTRTSRPHKTVKSESNGTFSKIEPSDQWQQKYSSSNRDKQLASIEKGRWKEVPQISIHPGTSDSADTDNNFNWDEDSEDVQVGGMPSQEACSQSTVQTVPTSGASHVDDKDKTATSKTECSDTDAAFSSRPKIPRTPPHHY